MEDNYGGSEDEIMDNFDNDQEEGFSDDSEGSQDYTSEQPDNPAEGSVNSDNAEEEDEDEASEESQDNYEVLQEDIVPDQPNQRRITSPFMTKFEKAKIIGVRAVQISKNAPLYLNSDNIANMNWDPITIAEKELAEKRIPFIIRRYLPDGSFEDWKLSELKTFD
jgi:DNA-directed RNA polymerase I, II, and III subunit RPABC2